MTTTARARSQRVRSPAWQRSARIRPVLAVAALAAGTVAWAALPARGASAGLKPTLIVAIACALLTVARFVGRQQGTARREPGRYVGPVAALPGQLWGNVRVLPWPQGMTVAVLGLEALHPPRPWHTAVLGLALLSVLLALHLAETGAGSSVFRPHLPLLVTGLGLAALSAGAAMLPALSGGAGWLAVVAAIAAVVVAALALPL